MKSLVLSVGFLLVIASSSSASSPQDDVVELPQPHKLLEWLDHANVWDSVNDMVESRGILKMDRKLVSELTQKFHPAFILPTDDAWKKHGIAGKVLERRPALREKFIRASVGKLNKRGGVVALQKTVGNSWLDTEVGGSYKLKNNDDGTLELCGLEFDSVMWTEKIGECATVLEPVILEDATIFPTTKVVIPKELEEKISQYAEVLVQRRKRSRDDKRIRL